MTKVLDIACWFFLVGNVLLVPINLLTGDYAGAAGSAVVAMLMIYMLRI